MTIGQLKSILNVHYHDYRIIEYSRDAAVLVYIDMATVRVDIAAQINEMRHIGTLIHMQPANWFQRWAWQLGVWKEREVIFK